MPEQHPGETFGRAAQSLIYRAGVFGRSPRVPVSPRELAAAAERRMTKQAWRYVAGSAGQESTARANRTAFDRWRIVPRMLRDTSRRDGSVELFGRRLPAPVLLAPIGVLELAHPEADLAVARAASELDTPMVISTQASAPMEDVAGELGTTPSWYQLYWPNDDRLAESLVARAEAIGASAIVVTLDTGLLGWRPRDLDIGWLPFSRGMGIAQYTSDPVFTEIAERRVPASAGDRPTLTAVRSLLTMARRYPGPLLRNLRSPLPRSAVETFIDVFSNPALDWGQLQWLRERTSLPIVLKGLQHPDDARRALDHGIDGIVVSNHGGRQVDGAIGSLDALPEVVREVDGTVPVLFDSGVRGGADVFTALALGARAVLVGRPYVYGLGLAGQRGVYEAVRNIIAEFDLTLALAGCTSPADVTADMLRRV
ncbi:lactate 2-monooxygenase [Allosaccharopolyspora coralli]|uniref:lactate 2-monooxygenase n=1 Tax=Allosaccharopolyspora coralli TaxID=2665642 RepID=UPI001C9E70E8|nr:lactate 2-monooxygenase [Allosaccharopolyspora coralli]